jgi:uncharacterized protein (TIGR02996 family)
MSAAEGARLRQALEEALVANPDDVATHSAYAALLLESGDPADAARGEFIAVQLALENPSLRAAERKKLKAREARLLKKHQREWLGELAPFLLDGFVTPQEQAAFYSPSQVTAFCFRRGWLHTLHRGNLALALARILRRSSESRFLQELMIDQASDYTGQREPGDAVPEREHSDALGICPLVDSPFLGNVRRLRLGPDQGDEYQDYNCFFHSTTAVGLVRGMPRLEELYLFANGFDLNELFALPTLANLRILQAYHSRQVYRLHLLDRPRTFNNLTHLLLHPHHISWWENRSLDEPDGYRREEGYLPLSVVRPLLRSKHLPNLQHLRLRCSSMGDAGCAEVVNSGILERLKSLDLRHGCVTDAGARLLADCPDLRRLESLDLDRNRLTATGIEALKSVGIPLRIDDQIGSNEPSDQHLNEGEFE